MAALLLSREPSLTAAAVKQRIRGGADSWGAASTYGYGKLNAHATLSPPPPITVSINGPTEAPEHAWGQCSWSAQTTGGSGPRSYQWKYDGAVVGTGTSWSGDTGTEGEHWLDVRVTDNTGNAYDGLGIDVFEDAECF